MICCRDLYAVTHQALEVLLSLESFLIVECLCSLNHRAVGLIRAFRC